MEIDNLIYSSIINYIRDIESVNFYNKYEILNIKVHSLHEDPFNYNVDYSIQFKYNFLGFSPSNWDARSIRIDKDGEDFLPYIRDTRINSVLKKEDES